ncbi:MAG TPA: hypothetical protein VK879_13875 [Candidatus Sulfomarinibacteraceae bacterium]|nr:hypothetical protein [Candidatus Sulfomarinibacteraceae bacterium]
MNGKWYERWLYCFSCTDDDVTGPHKDSNQPPDVKEFSEIEFLDITNAII